MKKKLIILITLIVIITTATTVLAFYVDDPYAQILMMRGYTEDDIMEINAITYLSDADIIGFVVQKYEELGDWKKVREHYGVDEVAYENYMFGQKMWQEVLNTVPENVMSEMKEAGWNQHEINTFVNKVNLSHIDFEYAWEECKKGNDIDELVKEKEKSDVKKSLLDTKFVNGEITEAEYKKEIAKAPFMSNKNIDETVSDAKKLRTKIHERHKQQSGITDEEIEYCKKQGMTNPMDMYQAKYLSKGNGISLEKVVKTKIKKSDWSKAIPEVLGVTAEEHEKQVKRALEE